MVIVVIGLAAWLTIVGCCVALCTVASRGDEVGLRDVEERGPRAGETPREDLLALEHLTRRLRSRVVRLR